MTNDKKYLLRELYEVVRNNPELTKMVNWEVFAERAREAGVHYHPDIGLMTEEGWKAIRDFVKP